MEVGNGLKEGQGSQVLAKSEGLRGRKLLG